MHTQTPDIFAFLDYRAWLGDTFKALQERDSSMTHRRFSQLCGYRSSGAISLILSHKRNLSKDAAKRIARALKLDPTQTQHLLLLVAFDECDDFDQRTRILKKMQAAQRFALHWSDTLDVYTFYSDWFLPVLREVTSLDHFQEDPSWLAETLTPKLTPKQAREGLQRLLDLGYLKRNPDTQRLQPAQKIISTPSEHRSHVLKQHHREMMRLASEALDTQPPEQRDMRVLTVAISQSQAERIKARLTQLQKELLSIVEEDEPIEVVYQLNTQWFALTHPSSNTERSS